MFRTDTDDAGCRTMADKVGTDADDRAGGCSNLRVRITQGAAIVVETWTPDEEDD